MIQLTQNQANVLELIRSGHSFSEIVKLTDKAEGFISNIINRLSELGAIERKHKKYTVLITEYQVVPKEQLNRHKKEKPKPTIEVPEDLKFYIKEHLKSGVKRSELARRLHITKPELLNLLEQMA